MRDAPAAAGAAPQLTSHREIDVLPRATQLGVQRFDEPAQLFDFGA
ncbi:MAG: hypothetical protein JNL83_08945 [Myxococcales bacterium]|nr:hypothetical protein [Myxococcales bacterium]